MRVTAGLLHVGACATLVARTLGDNVSDSVADSRSCCRLLCDAGVPNVILPSDSAYQVDVESYWSVTAQLHPSCFVLPENAQQVSLIVKTLVNKSKCQFAVRSGGHSAIAGWSNIDNGVTIDLSLMTAKSYDPHTNLLSIGPGNHWQAVYEYAESQGVMIPGARLGVVGVGGLLLGGGLSYFMHTLGLACDSVKRYEVVLANGDITEVTQDQHSDLWIALKGSQGAFAIVTRFDSEAFPDPKLWGGVLTYRNTPEITAAFIPAIKQWTDSIKNYLPGTAWVYWGHNGADPEPKDTIVTGLVDVSGQANAPAYHNITSIPGKIAGDMVPTNISTLTAFSRPFGYRNIWFTLTFINDVSLMRKAVDLHQKMVNDYGDIWGLDSDYQTQVLFQPFPSLIGKASAKNGGDITGIQKQTKEAILMLGSIAVRTAAQEKDARDKIMTFKNEMNAAILALNGLIDYEYINYADVTQNPLAGYGADNIKKMQAVQAKYDPTGVFRNRVPGGFNVPTK